VNKQRIREWCKQKERLENAPERKGAFSGKQSTFPQTQNELYAYVMDLRKSGNTVSTEILKVLKQYEISTLLRLVMDGFDSS
jgi:hypothetical protein